jgi:hypothetical protein
LSFQFFDQFVFAFSLANHRPIQSPAGPAAAAAMSTANAILGHNNRAHRGVEEEQHIARAGPYAAGKNWHLLLSANHILAFSNHM